MDTRAFINAHEIAPLKTVIEAYAPINIMPHYPPPGQCRRNGGVFNLILTSKVAPYVGNLTRTITHERKCAINKKLHVSEKVHNMASEKCILVLLGNNTWVVKFTSGVVDVHAFSDVLQPGHEFFLKVKREEWGGVFVDVQENDEIVVVKAEMKDCDRRNELVGFQFVTCFNIVSKIHALTLLSYALRLLPYLHFQKVVSSKTVKRYYYMVLLYKVLACRMCHCAHRYS